MTTRFLNDLFYSPIDPWKFTKAADTVLHDDESKIKASFPKSGRIFPCSKQHHKVGPYGNWRAILKKWRVWNSPRKMRTINCKEETLAIYKASDEYLQANPDAFAN
ncbi:hypothetical protein Syun_007986 [Stephania yunnanensis]|uniref:Uncharacterized protein n=1 Tax=Stephania yunnanensis TaxID=152371 RepID=A0AAP0L0J0_9MAGN